MLVQDGHSHNTHKWNLGLGATQVRPGWDLAWPGTCENLIWGQTWYRLFEGVLIRQQNPPMLWLGLWIDQVGTLRVILTRSQYPLRHGKAGLWSRLTWTRPLNPQVHVSAWDQGKTPRAAAFSSVYVSYGKERLNLILYQLTHREPSLRTWCLTGLSNWTNVLEFRPQGKRQECIIWAPSPSAEDSPYKNREHTQMKMKDEITTSSKSTEN